MRILFVVTALVTFTEAAKMTNLIKCNCTSILMPDAVVDRLQGLLRNVSNDERLALDVSKIVANISVALDSSGNNESTDILPQIIKWVTTLFENVNISNLATTVETLQRLQPILLAAKSNGKVSPRILNVLQLTMNLFLKVSSNLLGGPLKVSGGELMAGGDLVDEDSMRKLLDNKRLQSILRMIVRLLRSTLNASSPELVKDMLERLTPLLETLIGSVDGGMENVLTALLAHLSSLMERPPGNFSNVQNDATKPVSNLCAVPTFSDDSISIPLTETISIGALNSTLNARHATLSNSANTDAAEVINSIRKIQSILNDVVARRQVTPHQAEQLVPIITSLESSQTNSLRKSITTTIGVRSGTLVSPGPMITAVNLMVPSSLKLWRFLMIPSLSSRPLMSYVSQPAIQKDLQNSLSRITITPGSAETQRILDRFRTAVNGLAGCSNPSASMLRILLLAYQLLQATESTSHTRFRGIPSHNNMVPVVLKSLITIAPIQQGISPAVALLTTFIDSLHQKRQITLDGVISLLKEMLNDGRITRQSLVSVLVETLGMIPNLPPNISNALNDFLEQLTTYTEDSGDAQELISSLKNLQIVIESSTGRQRHSYLGAFLWLVNVLASIYNGDSVLSALLKPFKSMSVAPVRVSTIGNCDPTSLFGALTCSLSNLIDNSSHATLN